MHPVLFTFRPSTSARQQDEKLLQISAWQGIAAANHLMRDTEHDNVRRMCYAYVIQLSDVDKIVKELKALPEIEYSGVPAEREQINARR